MRGCTCPWDQSPRVASVVGKEGGAARGDVQPRRPQQWEGGLWADWTLRLQTPS